MRITPLNKNAQKQSFGFKVNLKTIVCTTELVQKMEAIKPAIGKDVSVTIEPITKGSDMLTFTVKSNFWSKPVSTRTFLENGRNTDQKFLTALKELADKISIARNPRKFEQIISEANS